MGQYGFPINSQEAYRLFRLAADQGHAEAQVSLAGLMINGLGIEKDDSMVVGLLHKAIKEPSAYAAAKRLIRDFLVLVVDDNVKSDEPSFDIFPKTRALTHDIALNYMKHSLDALGIKDESVFINNKLVALYENVSTFGDSLDYWNSLICDNLETPGFFITCIQPSERLKKYYVPGSKGEEEGYCFFNFGLPYSCIGEENPKYGSQFKAFLARKHEVFNDLCRIELELIDDLEALKGDSENVKSLQSQMQEEILLIPRAFQAARHGLAHLQTNLEATVKARNKAFRDENEALFK